MKDSTIFLDRNGYEQYLKDIEEAEQKLREIQLYKGEVAIHQGDNWHDNPALYETEMNERMAIKRLEDLKNGLNNIQIIESSSIPDEKDTVSINSLVTLSIDFDGEIEEHTSRLVASVSKGLDELSINSPLGSAILGKHLNDCVEYKVNSNSVSAKIIKIEK